MNNENKYKYINKLPKEYHKVFWDIMIKAESNSFVNECEKLTKNDCKIIMRYLYKITTENKQLKEDKNKAYKYLKEHIMIGKCKEYYELLEILGDKENE